MTQPNSFTDIGSGGRDLPDDLPNHCTCGAFLPKQWGYEEEGDYVEIDGRVRAITLYVWYVQCGKCGEVTVVRE